MHRDGEVSRFSVCVCGGIASSTGNAINTHAGVVVGINGYQIHCW